MTQPLEPVDPAILSRASSRLTALYRAATPQPWARWTDATGPGDPVVHLRSMASVLPEVAVMADGSNAAADALLIVTMRAVAASLADLLLRLADHTAVAPADDACNQAALDLATTILEASRG